MIPPVRESFSPIITWSSIRKHIYSIVIGLGAYAIYHAIREKLKGKFAVPAVMLVCLLLVPGIMLSNNYDDHDRSGRKTALAMAKKYLESCQPNAILFSIGDNDSFPLWYAQEIEGVRTDVRVVNTSLFQTDWYIDQMKRKAYESDPIPSSLSHEKYRFGTRDYIMKEIVTEDTLDIQRFINFVTNDDARTKYRHVLKREGYSDEDIAQLVKDGQVTRQQLNFNYLPTEYISIPVDKEAVLRNKIVAEKDADEIVDTINIKIKGGGLVKNRLLMLDIVANNNWERPIYFTGGAFGDDDYIWMKDYLQLDGMCYKLVPIRTPVDRANPFDMGRVDSEIMYPMVKSWDWGNSGDPNVYHDVETRKNGITYRGNIARLVEKLINEDQLDKAEEMADLAMEKMPVSIFEYYTLLEPYIIAYYDVGAPEKARNLFDEVSAKYQENLTYFSGLSDSDQSQYIEDIYIDIERYRALVDVVSAYDTDSSFIEQEKRSFNNYLRLFTGGPEPEPVSDPDLPKDNDSVTIPNDSSEN